jgi:hypothetical protein
LVIFGEAYLLRLTLNMIVYISASQVARITKFSHQYLAFKLYFLFFKDLEHLLFYEFPHAMSVCVPFNNKFEHLDYKK